MSREKQGYREMLCFLINDKSLPMTLTKKQAAEALDVSLTHLNTIISKGHLKIQDGKIPIGSLARYLCG